MFNAKYREIYSEHLKMEICAYIAHIDIDY